MALDSPSAPSPSVGEVVHVDNAELRDLLTQGVPVVDIRTPAEWAATGVLKGSHLLTFFDGKGGCDAAAWFEQVQRIAKPEWPIVVICRSGGRTLPVSRFLGQTGKFPRVCNVRAGILGWIGAGLPVESPGERSP